MRDEGWRDRHKYHFWPHVNSAFPHFSVCLCFCAENRKVSEWKWPLGATEKVLSWLMEVSARLLWLLLWILFTSPFLLTLCLADHIRFYAELSWECSTKSVSISRPQSSSAWVRLLMIVQEVYFGQGKVMEAASGVLYREDWRVKLKIYSYSEKSARLRCSPFSFHYIAIINSNKRLEMV